MISSTLRISSQVGVLRSLRREPLAASWLEGARLPSWQRNQTEIGCDTLALYAKAGPSLCKQGCACLLRNARESSNQEPLWLQHVSTQSRTRP